jgi:hypothetical protein
MLTNEQCRRVIARAEEQEWSGLSNDDIRMFDALIDAVKECHCACGFSGGDVAHACLPNSGSEK